MRQDKIVCMKIQSFEDNITRLIQNIESCNRKTHFRKNLKIKKINKK
jgi:hypothetical protein